MKPHFWLALVVPWGLVVKPHFWPAFRAFGVGGETPFLASCLALKLCEVIDRWLLTVAGRSSETSKEHVSRVRSAKSASLLMMIFLIFR